ncbi:hypothetical protein R3P38DRAFT_3222814 [Favolaschia claudopus]|uniref:Uncharacterized protein n=1 Tax=Favolaschia claudopus TaxID=2862362 RepID=A0AAV9ZYN8_9AGAR
MRVGGRFEGSVADFYYARDHACPFKILVEPLSKPKVLLTRSDLEEYRRAQDDEKASDAEEHSSPMPQASQSSTSSAASALSTTSTISRLVLRTSSNLQAIAAHFNWGGTVLADGMHPRHQVGQLLLAPSFTISLECSKVRECLSPVDHQSNQCTEDPSVHPAWNMDEPHVTLQVYDQRLYPRCLDRTFNFLNFMYKLLGQA